VCRIEKGAEMTVISPCEQCNGTGLARPDRDQLQDDKPRDAVRGKQSKTRCAACKGRGYHTSGIHPVPG
jgi:DnaJ-class molecular chaperone